MAHPIKKTKSPVWGIHIDKIPSVNGSVWGKSIQRLTKEEYIANIDNAVTMTDQVATGNGCSHDVALKQVEKDEGFYFLPTHRKLILDEAKRP